MNAGALCTHVWIRAYEFSDVTGYRQKEYVCRICGMHKIMDIPVTREPIRRKEKETTNTVLQKHWNRGGK